MRMLNVSLVVNKDMVRILSHINVTCCITIKRGRTLSVKFCELLVLTEFFLPMPKTCTCGDFWE